MGLDPRRLLKAIHHGLLPYRKWIRPLYWHVRFSLLNSRPIRAYTLSRRLKNRLDGFQCSVCESSRIFRISFFIDHQVDKCYCEQCHHIFSQKLNQDLHKASELFEYDKPNDQYEGQRHLQVE